MDIIADDGKIDFKDLELEPENVLVKCMGRYQTNSVENDQSGKSSEFHKNSDKKQ